MTPEEHLDLYYTLLEVAILNDAISIYMDDHLYSLLMAGGHLHKLTLYTWIHATRDQFVQNPHSLLIMRRDGSLIRKNLNEITGLAKPTVL